MGLIITKPNKKFGDVEKGATVYYLDPFLRTVEPCYVMGTLIPEGKREHLTITVLIVPKEDRLKPVGEMDPSKFRKIQITLPKAADLVLAGTNPPTLYSPEESTITEWLKYH